MKAQTKAAIDNVAGLIIMCAIQLMVLAAIVYAIASACTPDKTSEKSADQTAIVTQAPAYTRTAAPTAVSTQRTTAKPTATPKPTAKPTARPTATPKATQQPLFALSGSTSSGTPVVDRQRSRFSLSMADIYSTPNSSCFSQIGYCQSERVLVLKFRDSGITYLYLDVSSSTWSSLRNASSAGSYYNSYIKGRYTCYKWG